MSIYFSAFLVLTVLNAFKNISAKQSMKNVDPNTLAGITGLVTALISLPFAIHEGIPANMDWNFLYPFLFGGALYYMGRYFNFTALSLGDISFVFPLQGIVIIIAILSSFLLLGELPTFWGGLGAVFIFVGAYIIAIEKWHIRFVDPILALWKNPASRIYLIAMICYGFTVTIDRVGVQQSSFWFWSVCMNSFVVLFSMRAMVRDRQTLLSGIRKSFVSFSFVVLIHAVAYISQMYLVSKILSPYISSFRASSALLIVVVGGWFFKESHLVQRFFAATIMVAGMVIIAFYG